MQQNYPAMSWIQLGLEMVKEKQSSICLYCFQWVMPCPFQTFLFKLCWEL